MKIALLKLLNTEDLNTPLKNVKKMKTMSWAESPILFYTDNKINNIFLIALKDVTE